MIDNITNPDTKTVEWYTPPEIIKELDVFDLDPATSLEAIELNNSAKRFYTKEEDGLKQNWEGRIWLNPPYTNGIISCFMKKMANHNNGIALVSNRCDANWFQEYVFSKATSLFFLRKRIKFLMPNGKIAGSPAVGSVLVAYGNNNDKILRNIRLEGKYIKL